MANGKSGKAPKMGKTSRLTVRTPEKRAKFLKALSEEPNVARASRLSGFSKQSAYEWRNADADFAAAWDDAKAQGISLLEEEMLRRAVRGVEEDIYHQGIVVGQKKTYSDTLAIFLAKAARPEKYRERYSYEHTGAAGGPIKISASELSDDELAQVVADGIAEGMAKK